MEDTTRTFEKPIHIVPLPIALWIHTEKYTWIPGKALQKFPTVSKQVHMYRKVFKERCIM